MPVLRVALDVPLHRLFDYHADDATANDVGRLVRVPFGRQRKVGLIVAVVDSNDSDIPDDKLKPVEEILPDIPPLPPDWIALCEFTAAYYQAPLGETLLQMLPPGIKRLAPTKRRTIGIKTRSSASTPLPALTEEQSAAFNTIHNALGRFAPFLLHGVTGSGKTEVYLRLIDKVLQNGGQTLLLVPEINLTPQLETHIAARFSNVVTISLHSGLGEAARQRNWMAAQSGEARIILGTRLAIFTPMPDLQLIIIDEEHDSSFKQQDGLRYSARDVAVFRARQRHLPIVLGSATPSLESWANGQNRRYTLLSMATRAIESAKMPQIRLIDTRREKLVDGLSSQLRNALELRLQRNEQSLVFLNRRGYAPVLGCASCGWVSRCRRCAANLVVHLADRRLRCHHCGFEALVPRACPDCGNQNIAPFGRGTQRLEAHLAEHFPEARVLRVDRDSAKSPKQWEALLAKIHGGEADILVGTQMLAKGHDFPRLTLVGVVGADAALFAADWRGPERLFAQLMQVSGRAGRAELPGEVMIQTEYPDHALYRTLQTHDYPRFAASQLKEREEAGFPPYTHHAILRAEAPAMADALDFLNTARNWAGHAAHEHIMLFDAVPMRLHRKASLERAQLLIESPSRPALQRLLNEWRPTLGQIKAPSRLRWHLEIDPLEY